MNPFSDLGLPAIVTLVAIAIVIFLVSYVVPQVANVFAGTKRALPFLTVAMLALSDVVRSYGWAMLIALAQQQNHTSMAADFTTALEQESKHLQQVQMWFEEATLGTHLSSSSSAIGGETPASIH